VLGGNAVQHGAAYKAVAACHATMQQDASHKQTGIHLGSSVHSFGIRLLLAGAQQDVELLAVTEMPASSLE
jgi:hypothetical protein